MKAGVLVTMALGAAVLGLASAARAVPRPLPKEPSRPLPVPPVVPPVVPPDVPVRHGGGDGPDVVLSFMALRDLPGLDARLIEVPGRVAPGNRHPGWEWLEDLRDVEGRLVPNLLAHFGASDAARIAAFGFSAGANAGLRELLTHHEDRDRLSFVASLDGLHPQLGPDGYADPDRQVAPFGDAAIEAATGERVMVATASSIAAPVVPGIAFDRSRDAWEAVERTVADLYSEIVPPAEPPPAILDAAVRPDAVGGWGDFYLWLYPPTGDAQQDHRDQAEIIAPLIVEAMLVPLWQNEAGPGGIYV